MSAHLAVCVAFRKVFATRVLTPVQDAVLPFVYLRGSSGYYRASERSADSIRVETDKQDLVFSVCKLGLADGSYIISEDVMDGFYVIVLKSVYLYLKSVCY